MKNTQDIGKNGEDLAEAYLLNKGYQIRERNYRYKRSEIDIIAYKNEVIIFVEVKTRSGNKYGNPEEFVNRKKAAKVIEGAEGYIVDNNWHGRIQFDILAINMNTQEVEHFEDAFG